MFKKRNEIMKLKQDLKLERETNAKLQATINCLVNQQIETLKELEEYQDNDLNKLTKEEIKTKNLIQLRELGKSRKGVK